MWAKYHRLVELNKRPIFQRCGCLKSQNPEAGGLDMQIIALSLSPPMTLSSCACNPDISSLFSKDNSPIGLDSNP